MKKPISIVLSSLMLASTLVSCAPAQDKLDPAITLASSVAYSNAEWLDERLDVIPDDVVIGIGSNDSYGIDMSDFQDDGYIARAIGDEVLLFGKTEKGLDRAVREYAKAADLGATAELDTVYHEGVYIDRLTIAGNDISEYTITYKYDRDVKNPDTRTPTFGNAKYGAEELVRLLKKATGIELPMEPMTEKVDGPVIQIDYYTGDDLGENGFTYKVENGNIYINGVGIANGCANAVYYLLEHECGWDALLYGDSDLQEADHVDIPNGVKEAVKPMFNYYYMRHMYHDDFVTDKSAFSHAYRGSVNQASHGIEEWTGINQYFSHMCYTDEGNKMFAFDKIYTYLVNSEAAGLVIEEDIVYINLGMADNPNYCKCLDCVKLYKAEGYAFSAGFIDFANYISDSLAEEGFEEIKLTLYAYHGSNIPPKTAPRENIYITFCTNNSCMNHLLDGSECADGGAGVELASVVGQIHPDFRDAKCLNNGVYLEWLRGWGELTDNLYVFSYMLPGNFAEYTYFRHIYKDLHAIADAGASGFCPEAEYTGTGIGRLRFQLIMDIFWHPEMTEAEYEARMGEHLRREYGDGGDFVLDFIHIWEETEYNTGCWDGWTYGALIYGGHMDQVMYAERATEMYGLLEKALKQCNTAAQEDRVKRLMCDVLYKECYTQYFRAYDAGDTEKIDYLEGRFDLFVDYLSECGYDFKTLPDVWGFGPFAYNGLAKKVMQDTLEEAAWIDWLSYRNSLTAEGATQKPMPDKWVEWYETSTAAEQ